MRSIVALALRSSIPVQAWLDGPSRDLDTALELLNEEDARAHRRT